jgi:hypothetical protein
MVREKESSISLAPNLTFVRLVLPSIEAVSAPPLSATLGQVQINSNDFCKQFNAETSDRFEAGTLLNVHLFKNSDGTFYFTIRGIFSPFLFFQGADEHKFIPVEVLFDLYKLSRQGESDALNFTHAKQFFGALRSMGFKIIFLRDGGQFSEA